MPPHTFYLISEFTEVAGYNIKISVVLLYMNNKLSKKKKTQYNHIYNSIKNNIILKDTFNQGGE